MGSKGQNSTFSEYGHFAYQIKGNDACVNMVANVFFISPTPSPGPGDRVKGLISTFTEYCHVAYQIKGTDACSTMVAIFFLQPPLTLPPNLGMGSKGQGSAFLEHGHVAYEIKWNHTCSNMVPNILPTTPPPHLDTEGWGPKVKFCFDPTLTPDLWVRLKSDIEIVQISLFLLN